MDNYKNNEDNRKSYLLEGMYNGVAGKIEEVRQSVQRELQYNSAQQVDAYEALAGEFRAGVESVLNELRYVAQQSSAIHDYSSHERSGMRDALLEELHTQADDLLQKVSEHLDAQAVDAYRKVSEHLDARLDALDAEARELKIDYDALADRVAERLAARQAEEEERRAQELAAQEEAEKEAAEAPAEEGAEKPEAKHGEFDETFDYDLLAEKIAMAIPETDYDLIADKVVAALPQTDENALAEHIAIALPQVDETAIADKVAEVIPLTDYDLIAERVVAAIAESSDLKLSEENAERIAERVAELLRGDEGDLERIAQDTLAEEEEDDDEPEEEIAAAAAAPKKAVKPAPAPKKAGGVVPAVVPVAVPAPPEGMMTRYKRSFIAKIIESENDVKEYYSDLKNALLAYQKASSQVSWSNDRFTLKGDTVAKIGIRGRTLCLYLALNPDEFPETVYHQKFAGDTKMYEKTPMMVKIKSGVALKRAIRLIELLMEKNGAVREETAPIDYTAQYAYRSEEELLAEGLIKTAIVEKSDLDF